MQLSFRLLAIALIATHSSDRLHDLQTATELETLEQQEAWFHCHTDRCHVKLLTSERYRYITVM